MQKAVSFVERQSSARLWEGAYLAASSSRNAAWQCCCFLWGEVFSVSLELLRELLKWVWINLRCLHHSVCLTESVMVRCSIASKLSFCHIWSVLHVTIRVASQNTGWIFLKYRLFLIKKSYLLCLGVYSIKGLPWWLSGKESACQCRRLGFSPGVGKTPWEKEMATHSSILAWEIPWREEPGGLQSMGSQKSHTQLRHNLVSKQQQELINNVLILSSKQRRDLAIRIHSPPDSPPIQAAT